ncbi:pantoate--beta-alanine ligase [Halanaerobacter jeridensis]|uniref:Pantothenate synthetase n=2 Tax=Halanaerobacter jeridensis TaxID=706427 RepID=A0A939BPK3_9FIRM|nr:pantoate--beta-alanine ligase [Halanaerobacter jeridensis]
MREFINKEEGSIGFVPTMGYLHQGHLALVEKARQENDLVIVSIFVNPTQFGVGEDYEEYPRDLKRDTKLAETGGADAVFAPSVDEIYNPDHGTVVKIEGITENLCASSRPGFFEGICTIVSKLFNIINPDRAYFGQKDAQQVLVVKKLVAELNFAVEIRTIPIVREADGLAVSSRNQYLNDEERESATVLYRALELAEEIINEGERRVEVVKEKISSLIKEETDNIDYIEIVKQNSLKNLSEIKGSVLIALAVYIGQTRLIDNLMLEV